MDPWLPAEFEQPAATAATAATASTAEPAGAVPSALPAGFPLLAPPPGGFPGEAGFAAEPVDGVAVLGESIFPSRP